MQRKRLASTVAPIVGLLALAILAAYLLHTTPKSPGEAEEESRLLELRAMVERQEKESAEAVAAYAPRTAARLDDLSSSAEMGLRRLPGVARVEVAIRVEKATHRIVHLQDWHFVPKDLYAIEVKNAAGRPLSGEEMDRLHVELCLEVEAVQLEQMALLRCLVKHHGLKRIYCEGLTEKDLPNYKERIAGLRSMEREQIPQLRKQLEDVRELKGEMEASRSSTKFAWPGASPPLNSSGRKSRPSK